MTKTSALLLLLASCTELGSTGSSPTSGDVTSGDLDTSDVAADNVDATVVEDDEWTLDGATVIVFDGTAAVVTGDGATATEGLVTITAGGTYELQGDFDGALVVDAPDEAVVALVFAGASLTDDSGPALLVSNADDVLVHLAEGTDNALVSSADFPDGADAHAALHSEADLTISGTGSLYVTSTDDGVVGEDDLVLVDATVVVEAGDDCLRGKDALQLVSGSWTLTCGGDGLQSDNEEEAGRGWIAVEGGQLDVTAYGDGLDAATDVIVVGGALTLSVGDDGVHAGQTLAVEGGRIDVLASYEGLEALSLDLSGGEVYVRASDDGLNAAGDGVRELSIRGGTLWIDADGDGIDSNGSLTISGGEVTVFGPSGSGNGSLDADGQLLVNGGTVVATSSASMVETPESGSSQAWIAAQGSSVSSGAAVAVLHADGTQLGAFTAAKSFEVLVFSAPSLVSGGTYTVTVDGADWASVDEGVSVGGGGGPGGGGPGGRP